MRVTRLVAVSLMLTCGPFSAAYAVNPDDLPWDDIDRVLKEPANKPQRNAQQTDVATPNAAPPAPGPNSGSAPDDSATAPPVAPATSNAPAAAEPGSASSHPAIIAIDDLLYLPAARYLDANGKKSLAIFNEADRQTLAQFYDSRRGATVWVTKTGYNDDAKNLISAFKDADNWGLHPTEYKVPDLQPTATGEFNQDDLTSAEVKLALAAMAYARDARGDRITDPSSQLSTYLDRKPVVLDRRTFLDTLAAAPDKSAYLRSLHPKHPQFELLRQKLLALRTAAKEAEALKIPDGPKLMPGKSHPQIALIRKVLKVAPPTVKADGTPADDTYYDDGLARAVEAYKEKKGIDPVNPAITAALRRAFNHGSDLNETKLLANMEEWRWMPENLGKLYVDVNIPEFMVRVIKNGDIVHEERIVSGRYESQTPIFSSPMRTVVFLPRWNVPESIKLKELLPSLRAGGDPLARQGLVMEYNGRRRAAWDVDWSRTDIRNFNIYQPPGQGNALGVVKFLFPNKHSVYLHDTPSKSLFNERVRTFSHGCMRVRDPVKLAEVLLKEDKGWDRRTIDDLIANGPEENEISLAQPIPVHVTYFTAWVDNDGTVETFDDVYGHEKQITLALQGRWNEIEKNDEKVISPDDYNVASDAWSDGGSLFGDDDDPRHRHKHSGGFGNFFKNVFGGF
jgi:murein L,D-transpeptidase YcbB/YkuD